MNQKTVRIGSASGFWGDTASAAPALVKGGDIGYLVFDYLAEVTMSILAAQKGKDGSAGYATDFVHITMKALLPELKAKGIKVVANAGGVNPIACRDALAKVAEELGIPLKIGVVLGDDLSPRAAEFRERGITEMFSGAAFPQRTASINAYLGALPIARALDAGAEVVITGRCVDSAVTLGVLVHEFGWQPGDFDKLAQGTLAGHLVECGAQSNGGLFTDWETVPDWDIIGFPIVEAESDGSFVITKVAGSGGLVTPPPWRSRCSTRSATRAYRARRGLRLYRRALRAGGPRPRARHWRPAARRPPPTRSAAPSWTAFATWPSDHRRRAGRRQGAAHRRGLVQAHGTHAGRAGPAALQRKSASRSSAPKTCTAHTPGPIRARWC